MINNPPSQTGITDTIYNTYNCGLSHPNNENIDTQQHPEKKESDIKNNNPSSNMNNSKLNPNTIKLFKNNSNTNLPNATLLNNISYLNECFVNNSIENEHLNEGWRQLQITTLISSDKLHSENPNEIMYRGVLNKLVISHMFKNCSTSVDKFLILTKNTLSMYKNKENFLLNYKPQHTCNLKDIVNCKRIDFTFLNIQKLEGFYFMFVELHRKLNIKEEQEDLIFNIIKREKEGKFFVLFSQSEQILNEWIYTINYFKECCVLTSSINNAK
jgi:hypothetical protein